MVRLNTKVTYLRFYEITGRSSKRGMRYAKDRDVKAISRYSCMVTI